MSSSIDVYTPALRDEEESTSQTVQTAQIGIRSAERPAVRLIKFYRGPASVNAPKYGLLKSLRNLSDNWDEEGALAPSVETIEDAKNFLRVLDSIGQKAYHLCPGPTGEIMVNLRNKEKSLEILFYHDRKKYVKFSESESPSQGIFSMQYLKELLTWLNG